MKVFVIIPTYNRPKDLEKLLKCLNEQTEKPDVIIVADQSEKDILKINEKNCKKYGAFYLYVEDLPSLPRTRNKAIKFLFKNFNVETDDLVILLDDDVLLSKNFIKRVKEFAERIKNFSILGVIPSNFVNIWLNLSIISKVKTRIFALLGYYGCGVWIKNNLNKMFYNRSLILTKEIVKADWVSGCCLIIKSKILRKIRFDANLLRWGFMEDLDFCFRARKIEPIYLLPIIIIHKVSEEGRIKKREQLLMELIYPYYLLKKNIRNMAYFYLRKIFDFIFVIRGIILLPIYRILKRRKKYDTVAVLITLKVLKIIKWTNIEKILENFNQKILLKKS